MEIRFYNNRERVFTIQSTTTRGAIDLMNSTGIEWTRYKMDREPNIKKQTADTIQEYKENQITKAEYEAQLDRIRRNHDAWLSRNK